MGHETGLFEFVEKFGHLIFVNLFYNESLSYLLYFCTISYLRLIWEKGSAAKKRSFKIQ